MEEKYIKFYKTFHEKFKNDKNLIHCFELLSDGGVNHLICIQFHIFFIFHYLLHQGVIDNMPLIFGLTVRSAPAF